MKLTPVQARNKIRQELDKGNGAYIVARFYDVRVSSGVLQVSYDFKTWTDVPPGSEFRNYWGSAMFTYEPDDNYKRLVVVSTGGIDGATWAGAAWADVFYVCSTIEVVRETATQYVIAPLGFEQRVKKATGMLASYKGSKHHVELQLVEKPLKAFISGHWHAWQGTAKVMLSDESTKELREFATVDDCINWLFSSGNKEASRALNAHSKVGG